MDLFHGLHFQLVCTGLFWRIYTFLTLTSQLSHLSAFQSYSFNYAYYEKWKCSSLANFISVYLISLSHLLANIAPFLPTKETKPLI